MKNALTLFLLVTFLIGNVGFLQAETPTAKTGQPDIVFILLDDLRFDGLSCMNHPFVKTPQIDELCKLGVNMKNAFVTTSICCPSRATFLTGLYANQHGVIDNEASEYNPKVTPPLTKSLQEAGYRTAMVGKWHMGKHARPREYFDHWISFKGQGKYFDPLLNINGKNVKESGYTTDLLTDRAIDFVKAQPKDKPYFLMLSHKAVHEPFKPAARHKHAFGADTKDIEPTSWSTDLKNKPLWQRRQLVRETRWDYRSRDCENEVVPENIPPTEWIESDKYVQQHRCVAAVDDGVGRLMETLRERGTLEKTLIVFTSDNGYFHQEHRRRDKRLAYEESLRIPMIIAYPGKIDAGSSATQLVSNIDFAPTILDYAGAKIPEEMPGKSMKPLFEEKNPTWRNSIFYEYWVDLVHEIPTTIALRTQRYKLIQFPEIDDLDELYDLDSDPNELNNLAVSSEHTELLESMRKQLASSARECGWKPNVFPKNLPRFRGDKGTQLELSVEDGKLKNTTSREFEIEKVELNDEVMSFNGSESSIKVPFHESIDPSTWPFEIEIEVKPEEDGVVAVQASKRNGFKLFIEDGRPGISVLCTTWIAIHTTVDAPESAIGKWTKLKAHIDYNRVIFSVDGKVVESRMLPKPLMASTKSPLLIGSVGLHPVSDKVPNVPFKGEIRSVKISRALSN